MREPFTVVVTWATAFTVVASLYVPAALGVSSRATTPVMATIIAAGLFILSLRGYPRLQVAEANSLARGLSAMCLALALLGFILSGVAGRFDREYGLNDWGLLALQAGTPLLILFNNRRLQLLDALGWVCVGFAALDMALNAWLASQGNWQHDAGISGNTHAAGLVAFMAVALLAGRVSGRWRWILIALIVGSLLLIDARRYLAMAVVVTPLLSLRRAWRIPLALVAAVSAAVGLYGTFSTGLLSLGDDLRASLMEAGVSDALAHPLLGGGPAWRDSSALEATYQSLAGAGVTESGLLDLSIAYGLPAAALLMLSAVFALLAKRPRLTLAPVLLAMLTAELAFGDSLTGFLGAILFFTALTICQRDELRLLTTG